MAFELSRLAAVHGKSTRARHRRREGAAVPRAPGGARVGSPMLADAVLEEARDVRQRRASQAGGERRASLVVDLPRFQRAAPCGRCVAGAAPATQAPPCETQSGHRAVTGALAVAHDTSAPGRGGRGQAHGARSGNDLVALDSSPSVQALHRKGILGRCVLLCPLSILPAHRDRVIIIRNFEL